MEKGTQNVLCAVLVRLRYLFLDILETRTLLESLRWAE